MFSFNLYSDAIDNPFKKRGISGIYEFKTDETVIKHRFEQEGNIQVGLAVNLADGKIQYFSKLVEISKAEFVATPETGSVPLQVNFDASRLERVDSPAASFEWDFDGDGKYDEKETIATTEYTFEKIGVYNVGLRIVDIHNNFRTYFTFCQPSFAILLTILPILPTAFCQLPTAFFKDY